MNQYAIPDKIQAAVNVICGLGADDFNKLLNILRTLPLNMSEDALTLSLIEKLGTTKLNFAYVPQAIIALSSLHELHGEHRMFVKEFIDRKMAEHYSPNRLKLLFNASIAHSARRRALESLNRSGYLLTCSVHANVSLINDLEYEGKPISFSSFSFHVNHNNQSLMLNVSSEELMRIRQAIDSALKDAKNNEELLNDNLSFIRQ